MSQTVPTHIGSCKRMALINPECIGEPGLCSRSDAPMSDRQGTTMVNQQNQKKLSFKLHLLPMKLETMSTMILLKIYITGSCPPDKIRYCFCFSHFRIRRKGGNHRNCRCTCTCTYTCTCTCTGDSQGTVPHSRIQKVNEKES